LSLYEYAWPFVKCTYRTYSMLLKILLFHSIQVYQYRLCKADHVYLTYLMLQRQLSRLNGHKLDRRQVQASYIFCLASPSPTPRTCSFSCFCMTSACFLHNCAAGPRYISSAQTAQRTPPTAVPLLRACLLQPLPSNGHCL
jgi:hypothetical protein